MDKPTPSFYHYIQFRIMDLASLNSNIIQDEEINLMLSKYKIPKRLRPIIIHELIDFKAIIPIKLKNGFFRVNKFPKKIMYVSSENRHSKRKKILSFILDF